MSANVAKWEPIQVPEELKKPLIQAILRGTIDRKEFPLLWPDIELIQVIWPEGD